MSAKRAEQGRAQPTYRGSGVDVEAGDEVVRRIRRRVRATYGPRVVDDFGGFAGAFRLDYDEKLFKRNYRDPVLVSCTDGVGSKVLLAARARRLSTVGIDLVAMNVNDLLTSGAEPLFFLDYIAVHHVAPEQIERIVDGIARGCELADCALLGGETAEMPDVYRRGDFDLAGFAVGVVERGRLLDRRRARPGDDVIGLASSGIHSNGYSLVRRALLDGGRGRATRGRRASGARGGGKRDAQPAARPPYALNEVVHSLGRPLIDELLEPTRIYVRPVLATLRRYTQRPAIRSMAHVTGGGLPGNLPRMVPDDCDVILRRGSWAVPPVFGLLEHCDIEEAEMYRVFNMGIGFAMTVRPRSTAAVVRSLERAGESVFVLGQVKRGRGRVEFR